MPKQLALIEAPAPVAKPKRQRARKKAPDCTQCHHFIRVAGEPACTDIPQQPGKPCYKILKSLTPCDDFWRAKCSGG